MPPTPQQQSTDKTSAAQTPPEEVFEDYNLVVNCRDDESVTLKIVGAPIVDSDGRPTGDYRADSKSFLNGQVIHSSWLHPDILDLFEGGDDHTTTVLYREGSKPKEIEQGPHVDQFADRNPQVEQAERTRVARSQQSGRATG